MDIKDFDLGWFKEITQVIGVAKHLCGGATDLALYSFRLAKGRMKGLSIATCCHHSCDIKTYVNLKFIVEELGVKPEAFQSFVRCSSYAASATDNFEKRRAGFMVKRMIDLGRLLYVREVIGLESKGVQYCDCATESPESTLIIAYRKKETE